MRLGEEKFPMVNNSVCSGWMYPLILTEQRCDSDIKFSGTSVAQRCDTNINQVLKHVIKSGCVEYLSEVTQKQLHQGIKPADIKVDTTSATLHNASVSWLLSLWNWLNDHSKVVLDAWCHAPFKGWNLSHESLTSAFCPETVREQCAKDENFALSIIDKSQQTPYYPEFKEEHSSEHDNDYAIDLHLLCDTRGTPGSGLILPDGVAEHQGALVYTGDENLMDSKDEDCFEYDPTL